MIGEDFGDGLARRGLDLVIGVDEGNAQLFRKPAPDTGLARPHEPYEHDGARSQALP